MAWAQVIHVDSRGMIGRTLTFLRRWELTKSGRRPVCADRPPGSTAALVGRRQKGESLLIEDGAQVEGSIKFEGEKSQRFKAKLASESVHPSRIGGRIRQNLGVLDGGTGLCFRSVWNDAVFGQPGICTEAGAADNAELRWA